MGGSFGASDESDEDGKSRDSSRISGLWVERHAVSGP